MSNTLLYVIPALVWGSTWLAITFQLGVVPPEFSVAYRFLLAAALLFIYMRWRGMPMRFSLREHAFMLLQGLLLFSMNYVLVYLAEAQVASGLVSVIFSTIIVMNVLFGALFLKSRINGQVLLAGVIGVGGLAVIFWPELQTLDLAGGALAGLGMALLAAISASLGNVTSERNQRAGLPVLQAEAYGMLYGSAFTVVVALVRGAPLTFDTSLPYVASLLYLALFGSVVAFGTYLTLIGRIGSDRAAYVMILVPVIALLLSTVFEGLVLELWQVGGVALVLLGNLLVVNRKTKAT